MKSLFLGHQSWLVSSNNTNILIDPVLYNAFGSDDDNAIEIYPPREIALDRMPEIDAIILSHEHSDHFHIPTLIKFRDTPIFVSPLMVDCVLKTIELHGLVTKIIPFQTLFNIGDLEIILYPSGVDTVFWESRVSQILVRPVSEPQNGLYIAVDALVSQQFKDDIENESIDLPRAIVVSNNSQITPKGALGSLDNYKAPYNTDYAHITGLSLLKELLISYLEDIQQIENIIICGGGFTKKYDTYFGAFPFSDQAKLAEIANYFSINKKIFGPIPGQSLMIKEYVSYSPDCVSWVIPNIKRQMEIKEAGERYKKNPTFVDIKPISNRSFFKNWKMIESELNKLAKVFMLNEIGNLAIDFIASRQHAVCPYGLTIKFFSDRTLTTASQYVLNLNTAEFERVELSSIDENAIPFGLELFLNDFIGILTGQVQIWDLGGIAIKSWYLGHKLNSPVAFLYSYFGEQIHSDLNFKCFIQRWPVQTIGSEKIL
ncbi:MAG: MBL fold metallo-hydrolase [Silvanigrellaceae bacterium]|nr:MBL fold metallo-hydrolase [Silvanigrellaceae bacterium]